MADSRDRIIDLVEVVDNFFKPRKTMGEVMDEVAMERDRKFLQRLYGSGTGLSENMLVKHKDNNIAEIHFRSPIKVMWIDKEVALDIFWEKGKWTDSEGKERIKSKYCGHCSVCGSWSEYLTNFCGNCGADRKSVV